MNIQTKTTNLKLKSQFKIFHLCNEGTPELYDWINIVSKDELEEFKIVHSNVLWLINTQLNWDINKLSNFYGFKIAIYLRTVLKSKAPIIFYSPIKKEYFEKKSDQEIKYKILFGRGSGYIEAPFLEDEFIKLAESVQSLSKASLHDVVTMLCDLKGIVIDKLNHDLKFELGPEAVSKAMGSVAPYLSLFQKNMLKFDEYLDLLIEAASNKKIIDYEREKKSLIHLCYQVITEETENSVDIIKGEIIEKAKVLIVDDDPLQLQMIVDNLSGNFEVIPVNSASKAIDILNKDSNLSIKAIISDWRLYDDKYWQTLQGYELLEIAGENGFRALFALTMQSDFLVHQIRNLMNVDFFLYKKENLVEPGQWKLFKDILQEFCNKSTEVISMQPDGAQWTKEIFSEDKISKGRKVTEKIAVKSLKQQYIEIRNHGWSNFEKSISKKADEIWEYYINNSKNKHQYVKAINQNADFVKFPLEIPKKPSLMPVLLLRRIWLALWFSYKIEGRNKREELSQLSVDVYKTLYAPGQLTDNIKEDSPKGLANSLCIKVKTIGYKMLPEEVNWLKKHELI